MNQACYACESNCNAVTLPFESESIDGIFTSFTLELYIGHMWVPVEIVLGVKASQKRER